MGIQFRKSIKIAPGIKINIGKKNTSVSVGPSGAKVTMGTNGTHVSAGIPGTGVYYREKVSKKKKNSNMQVKNNKSWEYQDAGIPLRTNSENTMYAIIFTIIAIACFAGAAFAQLQPIGRVIIGGVGALSVLGAVTFFTAKSSDVDEKDNTSRIINNPFAFTLGILIIIGCIVLFIWSTGWEWTGHSKTNIYITYDFSWFKYLYYPFLIIVSIIGIIIVRIGLKEDKFE